MRMLFLATLALLAACNTTLVKPYTYIGTSKPVSEIAIIKASSEQSEFRPTFLSFSEGYASAEDRHTAARSTKLRDSSDNYPNELRLDPGRYSILISCDNKNSYGFPIALVSVTAGYTYEIACSRTTRDDRKVRAGISSAMPTVETSQNK